MVITTVTVIAISIGFGNKMEIKFSNNFFGYCNQSWVVIKMPGFSSFHQILK
jgi:hypothetical protein